jgi:ATP-dependent Clp protease ATP-binding subunit ClpA
VFTRFSQAAKRVLRAAEQASRNHNHYYVGVEHLLLALLEERDAAVEAQLAERNIDRRAVSAELRQSLGTGEDRMWDGILITPRVRSVIRLAEATAPEGAAIEPVDLLVAIVTDGGLAAEILTAPRETTQVNPR